MDDPCYHIGGDVPPIDIKIKNPKCGISRSPTQYKLQVVSTSGVIPTIKWCPSKIQDSNLNHLPQNAYLCINEKHTFMEIDDKGGEIVQRYESLYKGER